jgi:hypothetical protein
MDYLLSKNCNNYIKLTSLQNKKIPPKFIKFLSYFSLHLLKYLNFIKLLKLELNRKKLINNPQKSKINYKLFPMTKSPTL